MKFLALVAFVAVAGVAAAVPTRSLKDDLHEFVELIPVEKIKEVAHRYAATDAEVQQAIKYLQGAEWANLVGTVAADPSWQDFKKYLADAGIDIEAIIKALHDLIAGAGTKKQVAAGRTMRQFIDEVKALIPKGELLALLDDKLTNSVEFQQFFEKISSEKSHALVDKVRAIPEVKRVADVVRAWGIDLDKVLELVYGLFGWE